MDEEEARRYEAIDRRNLRQDFERRRVRVKQSVTLANVLSQLLAKKGYAHVQSQGLLEDAWMVSAEGMAAHTRCGKVKRGVLEIFVRDSLVLQEITFHKGELLRRMIAKCPDQKIKEIKFRVAVLD
ncbi:MAG: DciA family protein [Planctomycetaceae bacterium]